MEHKMEFRLEYNEKQGCFHHAKRPGRKDNTYGWVIISGYYGELDYILMQFTYYMNEQFKGRLGMDSNNLKASTVKKEWKRFLLIRGWLNDYQNSIYRFHDDPNYKPSQDV